MDLLTRGEEVVLLAVWRLREDAYGVPIRKLLIEMTDKTWSLSSVYDALDRLEKKRYLESYLSEPLNSRGGRSKRIYRHTREGLEAMVRLKTTQEKIWKGISKPALERKF
ncbi:PadR family transcriptional regulator [candidate division KSB1 bacterium]